MSTAAVIYLFIVALVGWVLAFWAAHSADTNQAKYDSEHFWHQMEKSRSRELQHEVDLQKEFRAAADRRYVRAMRRLNAVSEALNAEDDE